MQHELHWITISTTLLLFRIETYVGYALALHQSLYGYKRIAERVSLVHKFILWMA